MFPGNFSGFLVDFHRWCLRGYGIYGSAGKHVTQPLALSVSNFYTPALFAMLSNAGLVVGNLPGVLIQIGVGDDFGFSNGNSIVVAYLL